MVGKMGGVVALMAALAALLVGASSAFADGPAFSVNPASYNFGSRVMNSGPSSTEYFTVTNEGDADLTLDRASIVGEGGDGQMEINNDACSEATLGAGETCQIGVVFSPCSCAYPNGPGEITAELEFTDNAPDSPQDVPLSLATAWCHTGPPHSPSRPGPPAARLQVASARR
jgi:hypothetical protein